MLGNLFGNSDATSSIYLYWNTNDSAPVIEVQPSDAALMELIKSRKGNNVLEFYAHWCHHCRHLRPHYIEVAREVSELLYETKHTVKFYAISCVANIPLCNQYKITGYPTILILPALTSDSVLTNGTIPNEPKRYHRITTKDVLKNLNITVDTKQFLKVQAKQYATISKASSLSQSSSTTWPVKTKQQLYDDIFSSFHYNLRYGIYVSQNSLADPRKIALHNWLKLLQQTLPQTWHHIHNLINHLTKHFNQITENKVILIDIIDQHQHPSLGQLKKNYIWSQSCSKGEEGMGYTCGLWQLFHTITVGVVEYNSNLSSMSNNNGVTPNYITTTHVAETIRNFVDHFFQCEVCRYHFTSEYDACAYDRCNRLIETNHTFAQWKELPLWLVETHNGVNVRLFHENKTRTDIQESQPELLSNQEEYMVQWPSSSDCQKCWYLQFNYDKEGSKRVLEPENTYYFLKQYYWPSYTEKFQKHTSPLNYKIIVPMLLALCIVVFLKSKGIQYWKKKRKRGFALPNKA